MRLHRKLAFQGRYRDTATMSYVTAVLQINYRRDHLSSCIEESIFYHSIRYI